MRKLVGSSTLDTSLMEINEVVGRAGWGGQQWAVTQITGSQETRAAVQRLQLSCPNILQRVDQL